MSRPIIICDHLGKSYRLGVKQRKGSWISANLTLRETISSSVHSAWQILRGSREGHSGDNSLFWALRDVSFEIRQGDVFAIIGRNGAGKSTLLKILSRIVEPTEGTARLRGRVASLLEVGTGFHPELTGRENIYLNGSILGMRKTEINRKFDEIVAFSEIEEFLDTPVKRYSSGMYVRLAFAVAAHLEPEILIVDEVLAVGDFAFQKKCLGKMHDVATGEGRTILFVSHNMGALSQLCEQGILLEHGRVTTIGPVRDVIQTYLKSGLNHNTAQACFPLDSNKPCQYTSVEILRSDGTLGSVFSCDEPVIIRLQFEIRQPIPSVFLTLYLQNLDGTRVLFSDVRDTDLSVCERLDIGQHTFEIEVPARLLAPTTYLLTVSSTIRYTGTADQRDSCCEFVIRDTSGSLSGLPYHASILGILLPWDHCRGGLARASIPSNQEPSIGSGAQDPLPSSLG
jgi:lipopolysaccharide transport system ATP-binding protein